MIESGGRHNCNCSHYFFSLSFRRTSFKYTTINNLCFWLLLDHCYHPWSYWHHCCRWCCLLRVFDTRTIPSDDATSSLCALRDLSTSVVAYILLFWHDLVAKGRSCCALYRHINWKVIAGQNLRQEVQKLVPVKRTILFISITTDSGQKRSCSHYFKQRREEEKGYWWS